MQVFKSAGGSAAVSISPRALRRRGATAVRALGLLVLCTCATDESSDVAQALSPNPCTAVTMTAPQDGFIAVPGVPVTLTGAATCPAGQTPEYRYWAKQFLDRNWTILGPYVPGSSSWTPPFEAHWCVTVVARAVGATELYQVRASAKCNTPRCGNGTLDPGEQCDDGNTNNGDGCSSTCSISGPTYIKPSNTDASDRFGSAIAMSSDGATLAVAARAEDSAAFSGATYVFP